METILTIIGYICCILLVILVLSTLFCFLSYCFKNKDTFTIWDYKYDIDTTLSETKAEYKIMFRTPECKAYENYNIHIAKQGDEEVIVIDLI